MRALVIWPPQVLSYFNAGHHLLLYSVARYLRDHAEWTVEVVDASVESVTWKEIGDRLHQGEYGLIAIANDLDGIDGLPRLISYARELCPDARLVTFGRLSGMRPDLFARFDLDGIAGPGDYEPAVAGFGELVREGWAHARPIPGVHVRIDREWQQPSAPGVMLTGDQLVLPDITEIPYHCYDWLYRDDQNKFCGIPGRRELVVPAARGCPVGCDFCEVPKVFGKPDRRLPVPRTLSYIEESFAAMPFEYVAFYAPTFTLDRRWVVELCEELVRRGSPYPWKGATTVHHLDEQLVRLMGASGCVRVSVGVETLEAEAHPTLPRVKRKSDTQIGALADWCAAAGIELNCFVVIGLPSTTVAGAEATMAQVRELGARVRPTIYCPHERLSADLTLEEISLHNRQILRDDTISGRDDRRRAYDLMFGQERRKTQVGARIPERREPAAAAGATVAS